MQNTTKKVSKTAQLNKHAKEYIINAISADGYDIPLDSLITTQGKLKFLSEYGWHIARYGEQKSFQEWLMGLPTCFNIDFENYKILEIAKTWESIDLTRYALASPKVQRSMEDAILFNWWNFITVKTFQLFKKFNVANY